MANGIGPGGRMGRLSAIVDAQAGGLYQDLSVWQAGSPGDDAYSGGSGNDTIYGGDGHDTLIGLGGNDSLQGDEGDDVLDGGDGNDTLIGGAGSDLVRGGAGEDYMSAADADGSDTVLGGDGNDYLDSFGLNADRGNLVFGELGNDTLSSSRDHDTLDGGAGDDYFSVRGADAVAYGGEGSDYFWNGAGNAMLVGQGGDDTIESGSGRDTLLGGSGNDRLTTGAWNSSTYIYTDDVGDLLLGEDGDDLLQTRGQDDRLEGGAGNDTLNAEAGNDTLLGDVGNDTLNGGSGADSLRGGDGDDWLGVGGWDAAQQHYGDDFGDLLDGGSGNDTINGHDGNDMLLGGDGNDLLSGFVGDDDVQGGEGRDSLWGAAGNDTLSGGAGNDHADGHDGSDLLLGGAGDDTLNGYADQDSLYGGDGQDGLTGGAGDDALDGEAGNDSLAGGDGNDELDGETGNDSLQGGNGDDRLSGGGGNDRLSGDNGNDTLVADQGMDTLMGGAGDDVYEVHTGGAQINEYYPQGFDTLRTSVNGFKSVDMHLLDRVEYLGDAQAIAYWADALVDGRYWATPGEAITLSYSFKPSTAGRPDFSHADKARVREAMQLWEQGTQLRFVEVAEGGTLSFEHLTASYRINYSQPPGWALGPTQVQLDLRPGSPSGGPHTAAGFLDLMRTLGHALGHRVPSWSSTNDPATLPAAEAGRDFTLISTYAALSTLPEALPLFDLAAAQYLYGVNASIQAGDTVYRFNELQGASALLMDGSGSDTLDGSSVAAAVSGRTLTLDLREGARSHRGDTPDALLSTAGQVAIGYRTVIEHAIGSAGADLIVGNAAANRLQGGGGHDTLRGGAGSDTLEGGSGNDVYQVDRSDDQIVEAAYSGVDWVESSADSYLLPNQVENGRIVTEAAATLRGNGSHNLIEAGGGDNVLDGGSGIDTLSYVNARAGVSVDLSRSDAQATGGSGLDRISRFEHLVGSSHADSLSGDAEANRLEGGAGSDTLRGGAGDDTLVGGAGSDVYQLDEPGDRIIEGADEGLADRIESSLASTRLAEGIEEGAILRSAGATLIGNAADNRLISGAGDDSLIGGEGLDQADYSRASAAVVVDLALGQSSGGAGQDQLQGIEALSGSAFDDRLVGDAGANRLDGAGGRDTLVGGDGDDLYLNIEVGDLIVEQAGGGHDTVQSSLALTLLAEGVEDGLILRSDGAQMAGNTAANRLGGAAGADTLDGGQGADTLLGGAGDDIYLIDQAGDQVVETVGGGIDRMRGAVSFTLAAEVEQGELLGSGSISVYGNALDNLLVAGTGNNTPYGGSGTDTVSYAAATAAVRVDLAQSGAQVTGGSGSDSLRLIENLIGSAHGDQLTGNVQWNRLDGGAGADTLAGGDGGDSYVVDDVGDVVVELAGGGIDWVYTSLQTTALAEQVENGWIQRTGSATLYGNALDNLLVAGAGDNVLYGGGGTDTVSYVQATAGVSVSLLTEAAQNTGGSGRDTLQRVENLIGSAHNDVLTGNAGWNLLDGGAGADLLIGGGGSDSYWVDHTGDTVLETDAALVSGGNDWVYSKLASYSLGYAIENGAIEHSGRADLSGNELDNLLLAGAGDNVIDGQGGSDTVSYLKSAAGVVVSLALSGAQQTGGSGSDSLRQIQHLTGSRWADSLSGDASANVIKGGQGGDVIRGGLGNDLLYGGSDTRGDGAADRFVFDTAPQTNADRIYGFEADGLDRIELDAAVFSAIGASLEAGEFRSGAGVKAMDADDFLLFDTATGNLFYDADGSGAGAKVLFAKLINWSGSIGTEDFEISPAPGA